MAHWRHRTEDAPLLQAIGAQIYQERKDQRLSQEQLAEMAGITRQHLSAIEHAHRPYVSFAVVYRIACALGMSIDEYGLRKER